MFKYFDKEVHSKDAFLALMADDLSGTCKDGWTPLLEDDSFLPGIKHFKISERDFTEYLDDHCIINCEACGWWTYEGESVGQLCDSCYDEEHQDEE